MSTTFVMKGEPYAPRKRRAGKRCETKAAYSSEREALIAAGRIIGKKGSDKTKPVRLYHCDRCKKIHLTSDPEAFMNYVDARVIDRNDGFKGRGAANNTAWAIHQEWFAGYVSERIGTSTDPVLETIILSEMLQGAAPALGRLLEPESLCNYSPARFIPAWQNLHAMPYGFAMQIDEAETQ